MDILEYEALNNKYTITKLNSQIITLEAEKKSLENQSLATEQDDKENIETHDVSTYTEESEYQNLVKRYD